MKPPPDTPDEAALFRQTVGAVTPVKPSDKVLRKPAAPAPIPRQSMADERAVIASLLDQDPGPDMETGEELLFLRPGLQRNVLRRLRRGHFAVQASLDLHGLVVAEAREVLAEFLHQARQRDLRCIKIIHGKGLRSPNREPVLKGKLRGWLTQRQEVLAFAQARAIDGGAGAVLVLLARTR